MKHQYNNVRLEKLSAIALAFAVLGTGNAVLNAQTSAAGFVRITREQAVSGALPLGAPTAIPRPPLVAPDSFAVPRKQNSPTAGPTPIGIDPAPKVDPTGTLPPSPKSEPTPIGITPMPKEDPSGTLPLPPVTGPTPIGLDPAPKVDPTGTLPPPSPKSEPTPIGITPMPKEDPSGTLPLPPTTGPTPIGLDPAPKVDPTGTLPPSPKSEPTPIGITPMPPKEDPSGKLPPSSTTGPTASVPFLKKDAGVKRATSEKPQVNAVQKQQTLPARKAVNASAQ